MKKIIHTVVLLVASNVFVACAILPAAEHVTTSDTKHTYVLAGQGSPTVIFESGLGDGKDSWLPIFGVIAEETQVFAYNRAGYGSSRSSTSSRDGLTIVRELRSTLQELDLSPPYVLVGHSIGGTYIELYARTYPEDVAGVVFVDSRHADFTRQCLVADAGSCTPPAILSALMPAGPRREMAAGEETFDQVTNAGVFPDVPLVVLTGGKQLLTGKEFHGVWQKTQESLAELSSKSRHTVCERCGHYVQRDNPTLVINAIKDVIVRANIHRATINNEITGD